MILLFFTYSFIFEGVTSTLKRIINNEKIKLWEISKEESHELRRLIDYDINLVASQFDRKISLMHMSKTRIGYSIQLEYTKGKSCNTNWHT